MMLDSDPDGAAYQAILAHFIQTVRTDSEVAANCIEQIWEHYGTRRAYLAAYAILVMKQQYEENKRPVRSEDLNTYTFYDELCENAHALALYRQAAINLFPNLDKHTL
jgi:hypothetical protein